MHRFKHLALAAVLPYILIVASIVGIVASSVLLYDQVKIWQNPNYAAPCSLNPVLSCGSVINSAQGHFFGVPAPFFGLVTFPALATIGIMLAAGTQLKRKLWLGLQAAVTGGVLFALWLFWVSLYKVRALCPYCLATDVAVLTTAWYVTLHNIEQGLLFKDEKFDRTNRLFRKHHFDILIGLFVLVGAFILHHFWYYYGRNF